MDSESPSPTSSQSDATDATPAADPAPTIALNEAEATPTNAESPPTKIGENFGSLDLFPENDAKDFQKDPDTGKKDGGDTEIRSDDEKKDGDQPAPALPAKIDEADEQLHPYTIRKATEVHVRPESIRAWDVPTLKKDPDRIIALTGPSNSGRFFSAVGLALELLERDGTERIFRIDRANSESRLRNLAAGIVRGNSVYIVEGSLDAVAWEDWLASNRIHTIRSVLRVLPTSSWLILLGPTTAHEKLVAKLSMRVGTTTWTHDDSHLQQTLERHIAWYWSDYGVFDAPEWLRAHVASDSAALTERLRTPVKIDEFVRLVAQDPGATGLTADQPEGETALPQPTVALRKLAARIGTEESNASVRFNALKLHEKCLAFCTNFFAPLGREFVEFQYSIHIEQLKNEGAEVIHHGVVGFDTMYRSLRIRTDSDRLEFVDSDFESEVERQIRNNHHLLRPIEDQAWQIIKDTSAVINNESRRLCHILGCIAVHRPRQLAQAIFAYLEGQSSQETQRRAVFAAYTLAGICMTKHANFEFVRKILKTLSEKKHSASCQWAALETARYIHEALVRHQASALRDSEHLQHEEVNQTLRLCGTTLANVIKNASTHLRRNTLNDFRNSVFSCVLAMFRLRPNSTIESLLEWIGPQSNEEPILGNAARILLTKLFSHHAHIEKIDDHVAKALSDAFTPMLSDMLERRIPLLAEIFLIVRGWIEQEHDSELRTRYAPVPEPDKFRRMVHKRLIQAVNQSGFVARHIVRYLLSQYWLNSEQSDVIQIAGSVMNRIRLLDGVPADLPGGALAALFFDNTEVGEAQPLRHQAMSELYALLGPQVDSTAHFLGRASPLCELGAPLNPHGLKQVTGRIRLLAPSLEKTAVEPDLVFVLTTETPLDVNDIASIYDGSPSILQWPKESLSALDTLRKADHPDFQRHFGVYLDITLGWFDARIGHHLSRRLHDRSIDDWRQLVNRIVLNDTNTIANRQDAVIRRLDELVQNLDTPRTGAPDDLRLIAGGIQFLNRTAPSVAGDLLSRWLRSNDTALSRVAAAMIRMIARIDVERIVHVADGKVTNDATQRPPSIETYKHIIRLMPHLALGDHDDVVATLLHAIRHWLIDSAWATHLADSESPERKALIYAMRIAASKPYRAQLATLIQAWKDSKKYQKESLSVCLPLALRLLLALQSEVRDRHAIAPNSKGPQWGLLIVCMRDPANAEWIRELVAKWIPNTPGPTASSWDLPEAVFLAGNPCPLAVTGETLNQSDVSCSDIGRSPSLVAPPVLACNGTLNFVLILADHVPLDLADVENSSPHLRRFWRNPKLNAPPGWLSLDSPIDSALRVLSKAAKTIARGDLEK